MNAADSGSSSVRRPRRVAACRWDLARPSTVKRHANIAAESLAAWAAIVYIPRPDGVTLTREQYGQFLINNSAKR